MILVAAARVRAQRVAEDRGGAGLTTSMGELGPLLNLILPYFSIIALGFLIGKFKSIPESGLAWMNFFIIYVALPPLFFRLIADKPLEELAN